MLAMDKLAPMPSVTSVVPARNRLGGVAGRDPIRDQLLDDRDARAVAKADDRPPERRDARRAGGPAHEDGLRQPDPSRDVQHDAIAPQGTGQLGELVIGRQGGAISQQVQGALGIGMKQIGE